MPTSKRRAKAATKKAAPTRARATKPAPVEQHEAEPTAAPVAHSDETLAEIARHARPAPIEQHEV